MDQSADINRQVFESSDPMVARYTLDLTRPTLADPVGDIDRVVTALRASPATGQTWLDRVRVPLGLVQAAGRTLRDTSFKVEAVVAQAAEGPELIDLVPAGADADCVGLGVDVGTTTVSLYLVNMTRGCIIDKLAIENPQIAHGEDILSRIHFCLEPGGLQTLQKLVVECINRSIGGLSRNSGIRPDQIYAVSVAGNPTMMHLLLGFDPYYLCREPYVAVFGQALSFRARELTLGTHPEAPVYVFPSLGSYFGGDVVAGILASGMQRRTKPSLLVDVGTNAEIVLGNRDWLVVCAGAAGPALEGGGIRHGMSATEGAVERVRIDRRTREPILDVIGGGPPKGICGSGVIDLMAELYGAGIINPKGRITGQKDTQRVKRAGNARSYALVMAERGEGPHDIVVDERDIGNVLRAKAAMYTALSLITERMGIGFSDVETFFVAGSFGEHIDPRQAITIGMLPDLPLDRFSALGNSAGLGACMMLCSYSLRNEVETIRSKTAHIQLTTDNEFMNRLSAAMFIPHTDRGLFPSVVNDT